mgnify:CR=1 FL=1
MRAFNRSKDLRYYPGSPSLAATLLRKQDALRRLLVLLPNWLGDAVMALPALADIVRQEPGVVLDLAARPSIAPLVPLIPGAGRAVVLGARAVSIESIRRGAYDAALLLPNSFASAWLVKAAGVPERWGYRADARGWLLTRAVDPPSRVHQAAYYQHLATTLGFAPGPLPDRKSTRLNSSH